MSSFFRKEYLIILWMPDLNGSTQRAAVSDIRDATEVSCCVLYFICNVHIYYYVCLIDVQN